MLNLLNNESINCPICKVETCGCTLDSILFEKRGNPDPESYSQLLSTFDKKKAYLVHLNKKIEHSVFKEDIGKDAYCITQYDSESQCWRMSGFPETKEFVEKEVNSINKYR